MLFRRASPVRIHPYFGHRSERRLRISARALRSGHLNFDASGRWQAMRTMLAQYASREEQDVEIALQVDHPEHGLVEEVRRSDKEGFVHFDITLPAPMHLPDRTLWESVTLKWSNSEGRHTVSGHVLAPGRDVGLGVISDIDDTIIETGITGGLRSVLRNWRRVLQQMPEQRIAVPGADVFYNAIGGGSIDASDTQDAVPATARPFFYVSSSPWNLYSYLVAFKRVRGLPLGPVHLRDWGLNRATFGSSSHGTHKLDAIRSVLDHHTRLRFVLIGDDSQGDLVAFAEIAGDYGDRIAGIFIRRVGEAFSAEELAAKRAIEEGGVPLWLGDSFEVEQDFLAGSGLLHDQDATRVVEATQEAHPQS